jgi:cobalt-zinc-cadmium efflux system membrane fusion protein
MTNWTYRRPCSYAQIALLLTLGTGLAACGGREEPAEAAPATTTATAAAPDSVVALDSAAVRLAGIELVPVTTAGGDYLSANGTIAFDEDRAATVAPRTEGRVVRVLADLGESVRQGQTLALIESADVGQTRGEIASAQARMDVAKKNYEREKRLFEEKISSEKEMLEAEGEYRVALADYNSALARLRSVGAGAGQGATYALVAPVGGVVVERSARPGEVVGPEKNLFTVADLTHLWITTDVYESDLARVRKGAQATVTPRALGSASFPGKVTYAGGVVDPESRTFKVRVEVENESGRLRPGMYATVQIRTAAGGSGQIVVPEIAVQEVNGAQVVFVAGSQPGRFTVRPVTVGSPAGEGRLAIMQGLRAGERVVGKGAFQLKAELTKASFGEEG